MKMSREYLSNPNQNPNHNMNMNPSMSPQPPKRDSKIIIILLSLILVLVLAAITAFVLIAIKSKDENKENPGESQSVVVTEQTNPHKTGGLPQAGGDLPSIGSSSASSDTQNTATAAPNTQQPQTDSQGNPQPDPAPNTNPGGTAATNKALTKSEFISFLNEETAKAAQGSYKVTRSGVFRKAFDFGSATNALNSIIKGVDKNADLNSVVGGFLGIKEDPIKGTAANGKIEGAEAKYALKGMSLTETDVIDFQANASGTQYAIVIANSPTPNSSSPIAHATNDYITFAEVNKGIADEVGNAVVVEADRSSVNYNNIVFVVTVANGKITKIRYSYTLSAELSIKLAVITANGTGGADIKGEYTDISY